MKTIITSLLIVLMSTLSFASEGGGSEGGGGGTLVLQGDNPALLLDLYAYAKLEKDEPADDKIESNVYMERLGFQTIDITGTQAFEDFQDILEPWKKESPFLMNLILTSSKRIEWRFTNEDLPLVSSQLGVSEQTLKPIKGQLVPVVFYTSGLSALTNRKAWNQLGRLSRAALIFHEALRHLQVNYGYFGTNEELVEFTATVMTEDPYEVDVLEFLSGPARDTYLKRASFLLKMMDALEPSCIIIPSLELLIEETARRYEIKIETIDPDLHPKRQQVLRESYLYDAKQSRESFATYHKTLTSACSDPETHFFGRAFETDSSTAQEILQFNQTMNRLELRLGFAGIYPEIQSALEKTTKSFYSINRSVIWNGPGFKLPTNIYGAIERQVMEPLRHLNNYNEGNVEDYIDGELNIKHSDRKKMDRAIARVRSNIRKLKREYSN